MSSPELEKILSRLKNVRRSGSGFTACCPVHGDNSNSLSIGLGRDRQVLLHCFLNCEVTDIVAALGITMRDLFPRH